MTLSGSRWTMTVRPSPGVEYPVFVGTGMLDELPELLRGRAPAARYALIADDQVAELHAQRLLDLLRASGATVTLHTFAAGEAQKNRGVWGDLTDELLAVGVGRDGAVLALGGGVTGDLAGFVAATYMRGIPVVQLPTSLVAMIDSSVGGKTGVDVPAGKNLVGAFHQPAFVLADVELALTLPRRERAQGLAEAVKHGAILDAGYFERIQEGAEALLAGAVEPTGALVARSVELKGGVVTEDEREVGLRQILNFGHTLGHALEAASHFALPHGDAVALGMILESELGEELGVTRPGTTDRLIRALEAVELPVRVPTGFDPEVILDLVARDKKVRGGAARIVFLQEIGVTDPGEGWSRAVPAGELREFLRHALPSEV